MKSIYKAIAVGVAASVLLLPPVNEALSATMVQKALIEPLLLVVLGFLASELLPLRQSKSLAPAGVAMGTFLIVFWMIPRSIDMTQIHSGANVAYVICILGAGYLLSVGLPALPRVGTVIYALYTASMIVAVGLLYDFQTTLWCSAYTINDQIAFGRSLTIFGVLVYAIVLLSTPRLLTRGAGLPIPRST